MFDTPLPLAIPMLEALLYTCSWALLKCQPLSSLSITELLKEEYTMITRVKHCYFLGFLSLLSNIRTNNDLGHPMCDNLRQGNWMIGEFQFRLTNILSSYSLYVVSIGKLCVCVCV